MDPKSHEQKMIATMKERTGKTLEEWLEEIRPNLPAQKTGRIKWVKETYNLGQSTAFLLVHYLENDGQAMRTDDNTLVDALFSGENAGLRPLYDQLEAAISGLGADVLKRPCKTYVPFYRKKTFAYVRPLKGKLHVGVALPEDTPHPLLEPVGKLGGPERIKVKASFDDAAQLDEVMHLVKLAYEAN